METVKKIMTGLGVATLGVVGFVLATVWFSTLGHAMALVRDFLAGLIGL